MAAWHFTAEDWAVVDDICERGVTIKWRQRLVRNEAVFYAQEGETCPVRAARRALHWFNHHYTDRLRNHEVEHFRRVASQFDMPPATAEWIVRDLCHWFRGPLEDGMVGWDEVLNDFENVAPDNVLRRLRQQEKAVWAAEIARRYRDD